ncbi:MAG: FAD binding domain-containing protein [bacterium]|jgi:carbon-monoxide dehydrogenase medium subunit|nr:xanthine dehydrogenase family protein subunit M [Betaproteobacteria bacterium]
MYEFEYVRPKSVAEAAGFLAANSDARLMSGGMTLLPTMKQRLAQASHLVHVGPLGELKSITREGDALVIGSAATHDQVQGSEVVGAAIPALAKLARGIGDPQVRYMGTIGGSIANNDPAADYPAGVLGLGATVVTHLRQIAADDYFQGLFTTALGEGEIVTAVRFPVPRRAGYVKFAHPATGYAMSGVFVAETGSGVRVAVTGAGNGVFRWAEAEAALAKSMSPKALDGLALDASHFSEDIHATREYRAQLCRVMAARAVNELLG